ncbi:MAG: cysteine desulfurase [Acidobacteriota bacterium]
MQPAGALQGLDVEAVRADFPIFAQEIHGKPLVYLDTAATSQKPEVVIDAVTKVYREANANVHRGVHLLSERATGLYEGARDRVRRFLGAASRKEIVFVRGTTEAVNLVASSFGEPRLEPGDRVVVTAMEHHSNIVPWKVACERKGAELAVIPMDENGDLVLDGLDELLDERCKMLAMVHVSNALGVVNPVKELIAKARERGIPTLVDAAQSVPHLAVNVQELGCDFLALSGHKAYGPTGIGVLYGREALLEGMRPYQGGGDMIATVSFDEVTYNDLPYRFEAGTPNIAGVVGLGAALDYLDGLGFDAIAAHEDELVAHARAALAEVPRVRLLGSPRKQAGAISMSLEGLHPHDIGTVLDSEGVAVRTGLHCAEPAIRHFGVSASVRASFGVYNRREDIDALVVGLRKAVDLLG